MTNLYKLAGNAMDEYRADVGLKGRYKLVVRGPDEQVRRETDFFDNLITGGGMNAIFTQSSGPSGATIPLMAVAGSGSAPASTGDSTLQSYIGATASIYANVFTRNKDSSPHYCRRTYTFRGNQGAIVGNVSEVGVAMSNTPNAATPLFSRALVVDSNGNPTTVTVQADEYLDIVWEFTVYMTVNSGTFDQVIDGITTQFAYTTTPMGMDQTATNNGWTWMGTTYAMRSLWPNVSSNSASGYETNVIPDFGGTPSGSMAGFATSSADTYVNNSYERTYTIVMPLANGNFATGIGSIRLAMDFCAWAIFFTAAKVMKSATKTYTFRFKISLANV